MAGARFAWGIDVGNRALKAIRLVRDGSDQLHIDDYDVIEHEQILSQSGDNRESLVQSALANFAQRHATKGGAVGIGVSGQASFARFIKLPPVAPNKIPEIVRFEAIQQIPFPLEDVEWSYQLFSTADSPDVEVGIFAMRKELVQQNIKNFTDVGVDVHVVQMNPLAVYNALYQDERLSGTTMVIDLGAENTDLIIAEGEAIWMRSIPIGGNNFTEALVKSFKLKFNKAEELKRNAATSKYGRQILQAMRPVFADLVAEIQRSIGFYSSTHRDSRIAKVLALGGTFRLPGLQKYLQQNLQMDVTRIDRLGLEVPSDAKYASAFNDNILSSVSAYGLALQAMSKTKITSSLLPEKIQRERMWRDKTKWFAAAAATVMLGTGVAMGSIYWKNFQFKTQDEQYGKGKLAGVIRTADGLSSRWSKIESFGGEERKTMVNLNGAINDRNIMPELTSDLLSAFATTPSADELKLPRNQRKIVRLEGWKQDFFADMAPILALSDTDFQNRKHWVFDTLKPADASAGGMPTALVPRRGKAGTGVKKLAVTEAGQRGLVITLRCQTPYLHPDQLINDTVIKYLKSRTPSAAANPTTNYEIKRVLIAEQRKIDAGDRPLPASKNYHRPVNRGNRGGAGGIGIGGVGGGGVGAGGVGAGGVGGGGPGVISPLGQPGVGAAAPAAAPVEVDPWQDPLLPPEMQGEKGESMINDQIVTLVVAVIFDPQQPAKAPANSVATNQ
ncbi:MAG TPA: type IV pilus assembly protein PilM [Humisphaera sp.]|jgi:type IV pilus assembly protein PilM|nr:type IV pilus assembly protein PilM [Humisphaera sp.]